MTPSIKIILTTWLIVFSQVTDASKYSKSINPTRFTFNKISAAQLPTEFASANMDEIIKALTIQIKNCKEDHAESLTFKIGKQTFTRQQWCLDTNQKMLTIAQASQGNFQTFFTTIKNEFDWYKSSGWPENHGKIKKGEVKFTAYYYTHNRVSLGTQNIPLTAHASCATDHRVIPIGMIIFYKYKKATSWCITQDSGSAVKGAHLDLYRGKGSKAGEEGRHLFYAGSIYVALPKSK